MTDFSVAALAKKYWQMYEEAPSEYEDEPLFCDLLAAAISEALEEAERCGKENCIGWRLDENTNWMTVEAGAAKLAPFVAVARAAGAYDDFPCKSDCFRNHGSTADDPMTDPCSCGSDVLKHALAHPAVQAALTKETP